jgi:predicted 2-oxoglutarate/Fe(II)-dependent dioxygenase YbiX
LVALGDFEGGELCFPQLQILVKLKPGQIVAFPSYLLLHGNLPIVRGIRFSIVYFVHKNFLSKKFENLYNNANNDTFIEIQDLYNAQGHNPKQISLKKTQQFQIEEDSSEKSEKNKTDKRRYKDGKYIFYINVIF